MITDIPTSEEFDSAAKAQFDFAWDIVITFLLTLDEAGQYVDIEQEDVDAFWEKARQRILTSLIIAQQGVELAIKGKLVSHSPYLLISGNHSEWPKDKDGTGISFSEFRSIDAQDLIKVHDIVNGEKFDEEFARLFEKLRKLRNKAMHTVDAQLSVSAQEVVVMLLEVHAFLFPDDSWVTIRRDFLNESPATQIYFDNDHVEGIVAKEFLTVFGLLTPSQVNRFFGVDKRQRLYICPECKYEADRYEMIEPKYAVLRPNTPDSAGLYCFVCDKLHPVTRIGCENEGCLGNVISDEYEYCCTCGEIQG